ncbi:putative AAA+ superfamily ATPase [Arcanobacterium wilhelmae]|uniref:AAA+ superfamily ATPase n=1 Tax=Arcanobacterium wilhelmae TaxID=1803177 RepID=A0ABT9N943_9ACTO|nr:DUF4143 domain-containing protein [Arcanobacterium wilhelmae]MDP9800227.1 putative AAA+ superfamily ATPase [Arcanobacterium wilhelmae]WFN89666.1 DUF4143 domain-containing protein [Arcanobacterium wilhelmae]
MLNEQASDYLLRYVDFALDELLPELHGIAIDGPKGVGKTLTASRRAEKILRLDSPDARNVVASQTRTELTSGAVVLVDEWQHYPPVWDAARRLIDEKSATRFLFTGSASPTAGVNTHSGAGRIISLRMRPLSLSERTGTTPTILVRDMFANQKGSTPIRGESGYSFADYAREICATGFPEITGLSPRIRRMSIEGYITRIVDRDLPEAGLLIRRPAALRAWLAAYAAATSTTASYTKILTAALPAEGEQPSKSTALNYRDLLAKMWILDPLPAWMPTHAPFTRLSKAPKHHLADPGIAAYLMGVSEDILTSTDAGTQEIFGQLFESLLLLTLRGAAPLAEAHEYHFRTPNGEHEVDVILERFDGKCIAFEAKSSAEVTANDVKHLNWLEEKLGDRLLDKVLVYTGPSAYRRPDGVAVVPLAMLG